MALYVLALLIGVIAGLRSMTAPAAVSWAAYLGLIDLGASWLAFLGYRFTPWIMTILALGELITDKLPSTPSRKLLIPFATRIIMGGASGMAIGTPVDAFGRRERAAVGDRRRARRRDRALGRAGPRDAGAARRGGRGGAVGAHSLGRGHRGVEHDRHRPELDAIVAAAHAAGARISVDALPRPRTGRSTSRARRGHAGLLVLQVVRPAHRHPCGAPGLLAELVPDKLNPAPDEPPDRFELGTLPFEALAGVTAAAEYMLEVGFDAIRAHEEGLMRSRRRARGDRGRDALRRSRPTASRR